MNNDRNSFVIVTKVSKFAGAEDTNQLTLNIDMVSAFESSPDGGTKIVVDGEDVQVKEDFRTIYQLITKRTLL
jgi:hypothetical protein